tara:strand:- start:7282 stop:8025 length:744 start_codon:yes stop_codon:yes gene_type:complete
MKTQHYSDSLFFFSKISFTSQHLDFLNDLFNRAFFSTHLWIFSGVFAFLQCFWQYLTRLLVASSASTLVDNNPVNNPNAINSFFMISPFVVKNNNELFLDTLSYLRKYASMYKANIEPTEIFKALSDKTRLRILKILVSLPREEACLCELTEALQEPESNVSRHLKALRHSGLLQAEKEGRWIYHRLVPEKVIETFYLTISKLPDEDGSFKKDLSRFKSEIKKRTSDRCRNKSVNSNRSNPHHRKRA